MGQLAQQPLSDALRDPQVLQGIFIGLLIAAGCLAAAFVLSKALSRLPEGLMDFTSALNRIAAALEDGNTVRREDERDEILGTADRRLRELGQTVYADLDGLAAASGLRRTPQGEWVVVEPPQSRTEGAVFQNRNTPHEMIERASRVRAIGDAVRTVGQEYAPLPFRSPLYRPEDIAADQTEKSPSRQAFWDFLVQYIKRSGYDQMMPWDIHPAHPNWTWYDVIRTELILQCGWGPLPRIEEQFPPLQHHEPFLERRHRHH